MRKYGGTLRTIFCYMLEFEELCRYLTRDDKKVERSVLPMHDFFVYVFFVGNVREVP